MLYIGIDLVHQQETADEWIRAEPFIKLYQRNIPCIFLIPAGT